LAVHHEIGPDTCVVCGGGKDDSQEAERTEGREVGEMKIRWEPIEGEEIVRDKHVSAGDVPRVRRAKIPGGWFVFVQEWPQLGTAGAFFYPDPTHEWDGGSLD
jgi:hypothetical protein